MHGPSDLVKIFSKFESFQSHRKDINSCNLELRYEYLNSMSQRIWQEAGVFIAKNCEAEDEALEAVATKFKEAKKINTDYVIDSDDDVLSENGIETNRDKDIDLN